MELKLCFAIIEKPIRPIFSLIKFNAILRNQFWGANVNLRANLRVLQCPASVYFLPKKKSKLKWVRNVYKYSQLTKLRPEYKLMLHISDQNSYIWNETIILCPLPFFQLSLRYAKRKLILLFHSLGHYRADIYDDNGYQETRDI